jgi:putative addiction module killer protein
VNEGFHRLLAVRSRPTPFDYRYCDRIFQFRELGKAKSRFRDAHVAQAPLDNGIIYVTIQMIVDIREYHDRGGHNPFREWYDRLNAEAARKVTTALYRVGLGNFSNAKSAGAGVYECKINFGPGYRVYFGKEGEQIVILLGGGTKQRQQNDIKLALERWEDYKQRKKRQKEKEGK